MTAGVVIMLFGTWVLCQVFGGKALARLGINGDPTEPGKR